MGNVGTEGSLSGRTPAPVVGRPDRGPGEVGRGDEPPGSAAFRVAAATFVASLVALVVATLVLTGGTFTYPLDDPAIHLAVARRLALDGTWGVVAGNYEAASSSPLWTLLLAPTQVVARGAAGELIPLVLNVAAGLAVLGLLRPDLAVLRPSRTRRLDALAVAGLVVGCLFLPGLAVVGMEHTLHTAAALGVALAVEGRWARGGRPRPPWFVRSPGWAPFALMAVATAIRFESVALLPAFAVGFAVTPPASTGAEEVRSRRARVRAVAGLALASGSAIAATGVVNLAQGQRILPNSVVLKSMGDRGDTRRSLGAIAERFVSDPSLVAFALVSVLAIAVALRSTDGPPADRSPALFAGVVTLVAIAVHVSFGTVDPSRRYQAYLYGVGTWTLLRAVRLLAPAVGRRWPRAPAAALVLAFLPATLPAVAITAGQPIDSATTWEQRYQVARFLHGAYGEDPIAIGELGYISLYHDGPLTDVYGLADSEVLEARMQGRADATFWDDLQRRRGFRVMVAYSFALGGEEPDGWLPVAEWRSPDAYFDTTVFWATVPDEVGPLVEHLRRFEPDLPEGVEVTYNELAPFAAAARIEERTAG